MAARDSADPQSWDDWLALVNALSQAGQPQSPDDSSLKGAATNLLSPNYLDLRALPPEFSAPGYGPGDNGNTNNTSSPGMFGAQVASIDPAFFAQRGAQSSLDFKDLNSEFATRAQAAIAAAEAATGQKAVINSGYRSYDQQAKLYADYQAGRGGLAAAPGHSYHESGNAVDIAPGAVLDWLHKHAPEYGVEFLQGSAFKADPVHMQLAGSNAQFAGNPFGVTGAAPSPPPPLPNLRSTALAFQGANPYDAAPPFTPPPPSPTLAAFAQPPGSTAAPQAPTQTASSWLPKSLQPGGQGFVDNLGGGMSPLHSYTIPEDSTVAAGPYGADAAVRAAVAGDVAGFNKAMAAIMAAATKDALPAFLGGGGLGQDGVVQKLQGYFDTLPPGAVRAMQSAYNTNPELQKSIPPQLLPLVQQAFSNLPPQATGQTAMPNLRPPGLTGTDPLVAGNTPDPLAPKPAAFELPDFLKPQPLAFNSPDVWLPPSMVPGARANTAGPTAPDTTPPGVNPTQMRGLEGPDYSPATPRMPFAPGDNLDMRTDPESANAASRPYAPPAPNAAALAQLLGLGSSGLGSLIPKAQGPDFGSFFDPQPPSSSGPDFGSFFDPTMAMASPQSPQQMAGGFQPPPSFSPPPFPSPASLNPTQMRGLEGATGQGKINYSPLFNPSAGLPNFSGLPPGGIQNSPLFDIYGGMPNFGAPQSMMPKPNMRPAMPPPTAMLPTMPRPRQMNIGAAPQMPQPAPMNPMQAFQAMYGPAPQNVNWQATLAPDPFSQAAPGTYVLNDYGSRGPPQNALQEAASQQGDSYLNFPDFSFGY